MPEKFVVAAQQWSVIAAFGMAGVWVMRAFTSGRRLGQIEQLQIDMNAKMDAHIAEDRSWRQETTGRIDRIFEKLP